MSRVGDAERHGSPESFTMDKQRQTLLKTNTLSRTVTILVSVLAVLFLLTTIALAIVVGVKYSQEDEKMHQVITQSENGTVAATFNWPPPSGSLDARYKKATVASDHGMCSEIGRDVLLEGGNAVDSMIATLLCIGVVNPQSSGLGGGFLMTLYNRTTGLCQTINARESAPARATSTMFVNNASLSLMGYLSVAVPSELHGYWTVFKRFGSRKVSWSRLFEPAINLAKNGFPVSSNLAMVLVEKEKFIMAEDSMKETFVNPVTGHIFEEGDMMTRQRLGETMETIANSTDPVELFYKGGMAQTIADEILENQGIVEMSDLAAYETIIEDTPIVGSLPGDLEMCGPPPPSSFIITHSLIATMAEFYAGKKVDLSDPLVYHRLIEAEKFAYAQRTKLGDVAFVPSARDLVANMSQPAYAKWIASLIKDTAQAQDYYLGDSTTQVNLDMTKVPDHGTSHVSIVDASGNAVSTTSTINQLFGSMRVSPTLGIVWNDEMDDFSTPGASNAFGFAPSPSNFIEPKKRPMSSMSPAVVYNKNDNEVAMVVGASGGSFIISSTAQTVIRMLLFNQTVKEAVDAPRFHNQYLPHTTQYEQTVPKALINILEQQYLQNMTKVEKQKSVVQALSVLSDGFIHGNSDFRRQTATYPAGF